jgi:hypothetical protein
MMYPTNYMETGPDVLLQHDTAFVTFWNIIGLIHNHTPILAYYGLQSIRCAAILSTCNTKHPFQTLPPSQISLCGMFWFPGSRRLKKFAVFLALRSIIDRVRFCLFGDDSISLRLVDLVTAQEIQDESGPENYGGTSST